LLHKIEVEIAKSVRLCFHEFVSHGQTRSD
jgi:hypothetical protein